MSHPSQSDENARIFPHIPIEILRKIAEHLDLQSATQLARTCKTLRDAGEIRIWEAVDLTSTWDPANAALPDITSINDYVSRQEIVKHKLAAVKAALDSHPSRATYIRSLRLEPSDGLRVAADMLALLEIISTQLRRLDIVPLPWDSSWSISDQSLYSSQRFFTELCETRVPFPQLRQLRLGVSQPVLGLLGAILGLCPAVEEFECCSAEEAYSPFPAGQGTWTVMPKLKALSFNHLSDEDEGRCSKNLLVTILKHTPNLDTLRILGDWIPRASDMTLKAVARIPSLKTMVLLHQDGSMDIRSLSKHDLVVEDLVYEDETVDEMNELTFEQMMYPRMKDVRHLIVLTSPRMPEEEYIALGIRPFGIAEAGHLGSAAVQAFHRMPKLEVIFYRYIPDPFPSAYDNHPVLPEFYVAPDRWEAEGLRGSIIRQYFHAETGDFFWHIRGLSRSVDHPSMQAYVGPRRQWRDFTHFRGRTVPLHIMDGVYQEAGLSSRFVAGGRMLPLGDAADKSAAAWGVLRDWRAEAGDESEVEDDEGDLDSVDDESDDEDDEDEQADFGEHGIMMDDEWQDTDEDIEDDDDPLADWM